MKILARPLLIALLTFPAPIMALAQVITNPTTSFQGCVDRTVIPWVIGHARKDGKCVAEFTQDPGTGALSLVSGVAVPGANGGTVTGVTGGTGLSGGTITQNGTLSVLYGSAANTAAQGNDSRILGALQASNNLSEVTVPAIARSNLGAAPIASPALTGNPTAPTPSLADNSATIATTGYVQGNIPTVNSSAVLSARKNTSSGVVKLGLNYPGDGGLAYYSFFSSNCAPAPIPSPASNQARRPAPGSSTRRHD